MGVKNFLIAPIVFCMLWWYWVVFLVAIAATVGASLFVVQRKKKKRYLLMKRKAGERLEVAGYTFEEQLGFAKKAYRNQLSLPYPTEEMARRVTIAGLLHNWPELTEEQVRNVLEEPE